MSPRVRQVLFAALAVLLPVLLLLLGIWLGGHPSNLPSFARKVFVANNGTQVVDEAIERVSHDYYRPVSKNALANSSVAGMISSLHDPYSEYLSPKEFTSFDQPASFAGIGVSVDPKTAGLEVVHVFNSSPAQRAGLKPGETIVAVDSRSLHGVPADTATALIKGPPGTNVELTVKPVHGAPHTLTVTRAIISEPVVASTMRTVHGVKLGWVYLATFSEGSAAEVRAAVEKLLKQGARGLVFDLRADGGGLVSEARLIASIFIPSGVIVTTRGRSQPTTVLTAAGGAIPSSAPMVVLVDRDTASASEIVTAALQDHRRATVVGTHTYGKGVFQELEPLSGGGAIKITVGEYFTPNGRNLGGGGVKEGAGITPEVKVPRGVDTEHGLEVALHTLLAKVK
ncbi:MAG TPA: S41 family peptidase [Solirubrobacteraceae bacterium]|jgi:carboxyl-terminal processing protease|nr:S41 family peptidase [Solirubrobacteraceae bacterium]